MRFIAAESTGDGQVSSATTFDYCEPGDGTIRAAYGGGEIVDGRLMGWRALDRLRFRYVQVLCDGQVAVGQCQSRIVAGDQGRLGLIESWRRLGREGSGTSRLVAQTTTSLCE
ncbi:MAG: hypothetical protein IH940_10560 [Acidobacteria bacterium]|nr:hypothetical protein [Acidobacteriota bacterium]